MNKIFDGKRIQTFSSAKDFFTRGMDKGRKEFLICFDRETSDEIKGYMYKADLYDGLIESDDRMYNINCKARKFIEDRMILEQAFSLDKEQCTELLKILKGDKDE